MSEDRVRSLSILGLTGTFAGLLFGSIVGGRVNELSQHPSVQALNRNDKNKNLMLDEGEVFYALDQNGDGHLSKEELENGKQLSEYFAALGKAMIKTSENIDKTVAENQK